jgi:hypothetical protein
MRGAGVVQATRNSWVRRMTAKEVMRFACAAQLAAPLCCFSFRFLVTTDSRKAAADLLIF